MNAQDIDSFLKRWRATLSSYYAFDDVEGYFRRHRTEIEALVAHALAQRRARTGDRPEDPADYLAYDGVVASQRVLDARPDPQIIQQLMRAVDAQFSDGYAEWAVFGNFAVEYVDTRTESILLRDGWDAVPLLVDRPALAIIANGHVVAVRDQMGSLKIHPDHRGALSGLHADLHRAEAKVLHFREVIDIDPNTKERLTKYASAMWRHARKATQNFTPRRPNLRS